MFLTKTGIKRNPVTLACLILLIALPGIGIQQGKATGHRPALEATQNDHSPGSSPRGMVFIDPASPDRRKMSAPAFQGTDLVGHFLSLGNNAGLDLAHVNSEQIKLFDVTQSERSLPTLVLNGTNYFYAWQKFPDIEYAVLGYFGHFIKPVTKLTDNASATPQTFDLNPSNAATPNGRLGIAWIRLLTDPSRGTNYNVYFAVLNTKGNVLAGPVNVTQNGPSCDPPAPDCWDDGDDIDVPKFISPAVLATSDNRFVVSWIDERTLPDGLNTDIGYAVFASNGNLLRDHDDLKNGNPDIDLFATPRLLELANQRMLATYSLITQSSGESVPHFGVYSMAPGTMGSEILEDVEIIGAKSQNPDSVLLTNSKILVGWVNPDTRKVQRIILTDNGGASVTYNGADLKSFQNPDNRPSDEVSVSLLATSDGMGIFSWRDGQGNNRLYYALVNSFGSVVTPPLILWEDTDTQQPVTISQNGQGIAPLPDWIIYMPVISKP